MSPERTDARKGVYWARSRPRMVRWVFAAVFLVPGLALLGLLVFMLLGGIGGDFGAKVYFGILATLMGGAFTAAGLYLLPTIHVVSVDPEEGVVVSRSGRPFFPKNARKRSLDSYSAVSLTKEDVHETTSRWNVLGMVSESDNYRRHWRVGLDGTIFTTFDEEQARRLAETIGAAGAMPLRDGTGKRNITVAAEELDLPWIERVRRGEVDITDVGTAPPGIECVDVPGVRCYRGRSGGFITGRRWDLRIEHGRLGLKRGGIGFRRWLSFEEIELLRRDRRLRTVTRGLRAGRREYPLLRVVADRRTLQIPLNHDEEANWLYRRMSFDLVEMSAG